MKFVLEPMLFAFDRDLSKKELISYLEELLVLDDWWNQHRDDMFVQDNSCDALWESNYYPMADTLKPLMEKHCIDFIQFGDVNRIIDKILNKSRRVEALYDVLCEMKSQKLSKPLSVLPTVRRTRIMNDELLKLMWHIFMAHIIGGYDDKAFVVIAKGLSEIISIEYEYEELDEDYDWKENIGISEVNCKCSLNDFLSDSFTPFLLWKTAERKDDIDLGIRVALFQSDGEKDFNSVYSNYDFEIQESFYEDFCDGHYRSKDQEIKSTIHAVIDAVKEQNLRQVHAIRTGKKGNDPPLKVRGYDAKRRNITTSIKLAYWKKGHEFRFANMREHDFVDPTWE